VFKVSVALEIGLQN